MSANDFCLLQGCSLLKPTTGTCTAVASSQGTCHSPDATHCKSDLLSVLHPIPISSIAGRKVWEPTVSKAPTTQVTQLVLEPFPMIAFALGDKAVQI